MTQYVHDLLLWIHIPCGIASLILFWIPVGLKKGSTNHRKTGRYYYYMMWMVLASSGLLSICNTILGAYLPALYLGYLTILTAYPLWYSYEILQQKGTWSDNYFRVRKIFTAVLFTAGIGMLLLGMLKYKAMGMGTMMVFFGLLALPAGRDAFMTKDRAMARETRLKMHIQGTIISGIAAYTAFFAFGGSRILIDVLHMHPQWMVLPWILPTILGLTYSRYMKKKYGVVSSKSKPSRIQSSAIEKRPTFDQVEVQNA
jgi:hypothetical protein